jgi:type II secretory pathway pseudopilin PulG
MELVMVVGIMVTIAAIAVPNIAAMLGDARLDASADMIRARMADARSMATELNTPVRFGFISGTGRFQIAPDRSPAWDSSSHSGTIEDDDHITGELLEGVVFGTDPQGVSASGGGSWQVGGIFMPDGSARAGVNPDGTTTDDVTFYFGEAGSPPLAVRVHGVIGTVRIFDPSKGEGD